MRTRLIIALVVLNALAAAASPAQARAADPIIARDTMIQSIWALGGDLVYHRREFGKPLPARVWMARYRGRLHVARGIPRGAGGADMGRDAKGRKVFIFAVTRSEGGAVVSRKWFVYDLARNRSRALGGLPRTKCIVGVIGLWRDSVAYTTECKGDESPSVFLRKGKRTKRLPTVVG